MAHSIPCPECASRGLQSGLEEVESGTIHKCPRCGSRFGHTEKLIQGTAQGFGFAILMDVCGIALIVLFISISPTNPPWYYFVIGLVVLAIIYGILSRTLFNQVADKVNATNLCRINDEDQFHS